MMFGDRSWTLHGSWQNYLQRLNYTLIIFFRQQIAWRRLSEHNRNVANKNLPTTSCLKKIIRV